MAIDRIGNTGGFKRPERVDEGQNSTTASSKTPSDKDRIELSSTAKQIAGLSDRVRELPDIRSEKVAEIKESIARGTYHASPQDVARAILRFDDEIQR